MTNSKLILEHQIYLTLEKSFQAKLNVIVKHLMTKGFKKLDVYNTIKWKLANPIPHPEKDEIWATPMLKITDDWIDGKMCKIVRLKDDWCNVDEKDVYNFFTSGCSINIISLW